VFLIGGMLMVDRRTGGPATAFMIGFASDIALQETYSADFAAFFNSNTAIFVSLFIAVVVTRSMRSISVDTAAQRLLSSTWKQLAALARNPGMVDATELAAELVDRLGLLAPKLAASQSSSVSGADVLTDLRIGMNIALIQKYRAALPTGEGAVLTDLLQRVGAHFSALYAGGEAPPVSATLPALDSCLRASIAIPAESEVRRSGIAALVGLRRNMFPEAPAFAESLT
jgi:uncharacterized membrane protein YccC